MGLPIAGIIGGGRAAIGAIGRSPGTAGAIAQGIADLFPKLEDEVTVEVTGQPGSNKKQLYYLAMAAAYGLARPGGALRFLGSPPSLLMCEYDAADTWVRVTLRYKIGVMDFATRPIGTLTVITSGLPVVSGPKDELIGGRAQLPLPGFLPDAITQAPVFKPTLEFTGKVVLTSSGVCINPDPSAAGNATIYAPNPRPPGDQRSRGAVQTPNSSQVVADYLIPMIFASLSDPGSQNNMYYPPPIHSAVGG